MTEKIQKLLESSNPEDIAIAAFLLYKEGKIPGQIFNVPNITNHDSYGLIIKFKDFDIWVSVITRFLKIFGKGLLSEADCTVINFENET